MRDLSKNLSNLVDLGVGTGATYLGGLAAMSFSAWVLWDTAVTTGTGNNRIFGLEVGSGDEGFTALIDDDGLGNFYLRMQGRSQPAETLRSASTQVHAIPTGTLTHVAGAFDIANDTIYRWTAGNQQTTSQPFTAATWNVSGSYLDTDRIGANAGAVSSTNIQWDGGIGHLAFFNRLITQDEVTALTLGMDPRMIEGAVLYWPLLGYDDPERCLITGQAATISGSVPRRADEAPVIPFEYLQAQTSGHLQASGQAVTPHFMNLIRQMAA
jgi:hypothetical protein